MNTLAEKEAGALAAHVVRQQREKEWLASLKVGSEVAINPGHSRRFEVVKITRETPKFWVVGYWKYRKDNGHGVGGHRWSGPGWLHEPTDEMREAQERHQLAETLERVPWRKAPMHILRAARAALDTPRPSETVTPVTD